jgi:hypothetical protein
MSVRKGVMFTLPLSLLVESNRQSSYPVLGGITGTWHELTPLP